MAKKTTVEDVREMVDTVEKATKKDEKQPFQLVPLKTGARRKTLLVSLNSLIKLDKTDIRHARYAMRELNRQHVEHLMYSFMAFDSDSENDKFPPLKVVGTNWGNAVIDGNHRWQAIEDALKSRFEGEELSEKRSHFQVEVEPLNDLTERQILKEAFEANKRNGLPMSRDSCSRYAMWLMEDAKEHGEEMSQREAARIAGCSQSAISQMIKKEMERQHKMIDDFVTNKEDEKEIIAEIEKKDEKDEEDQMISNSKRLFSAIKYIGDVSDDSQILAEYLQQYASPDYRDNVHVIAQALELVYKQLDAIAVSSQLSVKDVVRPVETPIDGIDLPDTTETDNGILTDSDGILFDIE